MTPRALLHRLLDNESLNFWFSNHIPRSLLTRWVGRISKSEQPLVRAVSLGLWKFFSDVDLSDSVEQRFASMHACFTRKLKEGARPIDPHVDTLVSPCDAIVGGCGIIEGETLIQAKGLTYTLTELTRDPSLADRYRNGSYVTLRLTAGMYHRFHAPYDCTVARVSYISGDVWNVNPPALKRIAKLFCKNERAVIEARLPWRENIALIPVAAVLVASIRLRFLDVLLDMDYAGPSVFDCEYHASKGHELGWFEHGSTIIVLTPPGYRLSNSIQTGQRIRMGEPLLLRDSRAGADGDL
jgi:phosphatidylserine decarboxylase